MVDTQTVSVAVPQRRTKIVNTLWQGGTIIALLALIAIFGILRPEQFLSVTNLRNILEQIAILAILAAAQTVVMVAGDFDLSVGANAILSGAVAAVAMVAGVPTGLAILLGLGMGLVIGLFNGVLVAYLGLSPFIVTLASMTAVGGLIFIVTDGTTVYGLPEDFFWIGQSRPFGIPMPIFIAAGFALLIWFLLRFTVIGRRWYAVGGNPEVARLSGINVAAARVAAFGVAGFGSAIGGLILASRLGNVSPQPGSNYMLFAVAAVFLGMTLVSSVAANLPGTMVGVLIIGVMSNGLNLVGANTYVQQVLTGIIIIAAVALSAMRKRTH
ncbi:MAG: ABC transporter permease [Microbacteriaceae bacterium]|nr:ABC transporter permease [Microbacteriaceae bacterium]